MAAKGKGVLALLMGEPKTEKEPKSEKTEMESEEEGCCSEEQTAAAEELIQAVEDKDSEAVVYAIKALVRSCMM